MYLYNETSTIFFSGLVHRDVKLDNILVFKSNFSKVKLCDMGETRTINSTVLRRHEWLPYSPPEVISTQVDNSYRYDQFYGQVLLYFNLEIIFDFNVSSILIYNVKIGDNLKIKIEEQLVVISYTAT